MSRTELLTIGAFARSSGLTAGALRFYADSGMLEPAVVDRSTGYRYYSPDQVERAKTIRRLREIGMPLERIAEVFESDGRGAARIIDDHVASLAHRAHRAVETAAAVKAGLDPTPRSPSVRVNGSVFTTAVEQVLTSTAHEPELPVLNGVHVEVSVEGIALTATDRYRLSTRTVVPTRADGPGWTATVHADDLRLAMPWARRRHELRLSARAGSVRLRGDDATTRDCRTLTEPFPDYRLVLAALPDVRTRVVVSRNALVRSLETASDHRVRLNVSTSDSTVTVSSSGTAEPTSITAVVTGPAIALDFAVTTLHPAVSTAAGPDVMLDIAAADQPVVVRSADDGDLTIVTMPLRPEPPHPREQEGPAT